MSQEVRQAGVQEQTQQLLQGPLKHVRAAALAAALVPVAALVATPANAQALCGSGGVCGLVFNDLNHNGLQDAGEPGIGGVTVTLSDGTSTTTNADGSYVIFGIPDGPITITVTIPAGYTTSPPNVGANDAIDSDGSPDGFGNSVATVTVVGGAADTDFGFFSNGVQSPGTGTL